MQTETPIVMSGVFAQLADEFVAFKRAQGYKYDSEAKVLRRFCHFSENYNLTMPVLSKELALDWISPREGEAAKSRLHRVTLLNQFGRFLVDTGHEAYVPSSRHWMPDSFTPYIFTHEEIGRILQAADHIQPVSQSREMHKELPVLFRLLYGCGLRVSEAVKLLCKDVDLDNGILTIREAKNGRDRLIPLSLSLQHLMQEYKAHMGCQLRDEDFFFPAPDRTMLSTFTVYQRFRRLLWAAGIPYKGKGKGPRLHDLRHTFAVHTLQKWVEAGEDLMAMLPVLSIFMGHKSMQATSRYLRLTAEVYPDVIRQVEATCAYVIPSGEKA